MAAATTRRLQNRTHAHTHHAHTPADARTHATAPCGATLPTDPTGAHRNDPDGGPTLSRHADASQRHSADTDGATDASHGEPAGPPRRRAERDTAEQVSSKPAHASVPVAPEVRPHAAHASRAARAQSDQHAGAEQDRDAGAREAHHPDSHTSHAVRSDVLHVQVRLLSKLQSPTEFKGLRPCTILPVSEKIVSKTFSASRGDMRRSQQS